MRALTVKPGRPGSLEVTGVPDPTPEPGELLVDDGGADVKVVIDLYL